MGFVLQSWSQLLPHGHRLGVTASLVLTLLLPALLLILTELHQSVSPSTSTFDNIIHSACNDLGISASSVEPHTSGGDDEVQKPVFPNTISLHLVDPTLHSCLDSHSPSIIPTVPKAALRSSRTSPRAKSLQWWLWWAQPAQAAQPWLRVQWRLRRQGHPRRPARDEIPATSEPDFPD